MCCQPVLGDWREKVKAAKVQTKSKAGSDHGKPEPDSKAAAAAAGAPAVAATPAGRPDLAALSAGLPEGWRAMWDKQSNDVYYGNPSTKVCSARLGWRPAHQMQRRSKA